MIATSGFLTALECTKSIFGPGSAPDPAGGAYSAPPDSLAGFKGSYLLLRKGKGGAGKGRAGRGRERKGRGRGGEGKEGRGGEGGDAPQLQLLDPPLPKYISQHIESGLWMFCQGKLSCRDFVPNSRRVARAVEVYSTTDVWWRRRCSTIRDHLSAQLGYDKLFQNKHASTLIIVSYWYQAFVTKLNVLPVFYLQMILRTNT